MLTAPSQAPQDFDVTNFQKETRKTKMSEDLDPEWHYNYGGETGYITNALRSRLTVGAIRQTQMSVKPYLWDLELAQTI